MYVLVFYCLGESISGFGSLDLCTLPPVLGNVRLGLQIEDSDAIVRSI